MKRLPDFLWILLLAFFLIKGIGYISKDGYDTLGHADGFTEDFVRKGVKNYLLNGPSKTAFLPDWPGFQLETTVEELQGSSIYTHYFPGPGYIVYAAFLVFGDSPLTWQWVRLVPLLCIFFSLLLLTWSLEVRVFNGWPWGKVGVGLFLFFVPALKWWAISLHGHAYTTACILMGFSLGLLASKTSWYKEGRRSLWVPLACFALGFISNYMLLTAAFVVCAAPMVGGFLSPEPGCTKRAIKLSFWVGIGLTGAWIIHLGQVAWLLDSWALAWEDQVGTAVARSTAFKEGPNRIQLIGQYSHHVRRFFFVSALSMLSLSFFALWLHPKHPQKARWVLATLIASLAGYAWIMLLKNHSIDHPHVNPRIFMLQYVVFLAVLGRLASQKGRGKLGF